MQYVKVGRVTSQSVHKGTGQHWDQWIEILNSQGASNWTHQEIVAFLKKKYKLGPWWQQGVTTGYEIVIGRRVEGQNQKGEYSVMTTGTFAVDVKALWKFLFSPQGLEIWLKPLSGFRLEKGFTYETEDGVFGEVRTFKSCQRLRMTWQDSDGERATLVQIQLVKRPGSKCILAFAHEKLSNNRERQQKRAFWQERMGALRVIVSQKST
jgi:uncharacterized protein YndB with AHSA1/START domain